MAWGSIEEKDWHLDFLRRRVEWVQEKRNREHLSRIEVDVLWLENLLIENLSLHESVVAHQRRIMDMASAMYPIVQRINVEDKKGL